MATAQDKQVVVRAGRIALQAAVDELVAMAGAMAGSGHPGEADAIRDQYARWGGVLKKVVADSLPELGQTRFEVTVPQVEVCPKCGAFGELAGLEREGAQRQEVGIVCVSCRHGWWR